MTALEIVEQKLQAIRIERGQAAEKLNALQLVESNLLEVRNSILKEWEREKALEEKRKKEEEKSHGTSNASEV